MCARSVLSASLGSFIFFNESELGSHFSSLSVLLCLIQTEIIGGAQAPPAPPASDGLGVEARVCMSVFSKLMSWSNANTSCMRVDES